MKVCIETEYAQRQSPKKYHTTCNSNDAYNMQLPAHYKNIMSSEESLEIKVQCTCLLADRFMNIFIIPKGK
jgi:hypothetical protein